MAVVRAKVDLLEEDLPGAHLPAEDLAALLLPVELPLELDPVDPLEEDLALARVRADLVLEAPVVRVAAVDERTRSSIPRMAKFPTRRRLARSPTT